MTSHATGSLGFFSLGAATMSACFVQGLANGSALDSPIITVVLFVLLVSSWVASVYVCVRLRTSRRIHLLALIILIPLGFLLGWIYLMLTASILPRQQGEDGTSG